MTKKFSMSRKSRTPGGDKSSPMEAVTRLVDEREKYEQWLDELEAKKDSTPPKVFDRVRQDYLARLQAVMDQLKEHTAVLQEHAANLVARLRELEAREQHITDELAETELRANVGEITEAEWEATSRKAQREVAKLKENQEVIADDLIRIRDILSNGGDEDEDEEDAPRTSADFDELEFLKSVVGPSTGAHAPAPKPPAPAPKPTTPPSAPAVRRTPSAGTPPSPRTGDVPLAGTAAKPTTGEVPLTPTAAPSPPPGPAPAAPRPTPSAASAASSAPPAAAPAPPAPPAPPAAPAPKPEVRKPAEPPRPDNALGLRTSDVAEQKTLKCAECGSMNYPAEWYCERCGAELAQI